MPLSSAARAVLARLEERGASFHTDLLDGTGLLRAQLEEALGELVAWGLVTADGFTGIRALLVPQDRRPGGRRRSPSYSLEEAGRWTLLRRPLAAGDSLPPEDLEAIARTLLRRYGVVFRRLAERESALPPWRQLLRVYHRMEARGEIRGGRFVAGFSGEQFALPEAVGTLRESRREGGGTDLLSLSASDPLNLIGLIVPGPRVPAVAGNRILFRGGIPAAIRVGGEVQMLGAHAPDEVWKAKKALLRRAFPERLRAYIG
jgi:ATP-dependent Lhr-like helicase